MAPNFMRSSYLDNLQYGWNEIWLDRPLVNPVFIYTIK